MITSLAYKFPQPKTGIPEFQGRVLLCKQITREEEVDTPQYFKFLLASSTNGLFCFAFHISRNFSKPKSLSRLFLRKAFFATLQKAVLRLKIVI